MEAAAVGAHEDEGVGGGAVVGEGAFEGAGGEDDVEWRWGGG